MTRIQKSGALMFLGMILFITGASIHLLGLLALVLGWVAAGCTGYFLICNGRPFEAPWSLKKTGTLSAFIIFGFFSLGTVAILPEKVDSE